MTTAGDVFENPSTRETGVILVGGDDTDGRYLHSEMRVRPGGAVSVAHAHPSIRERFEVVEGTLTLRVDGQEHRLTAGERRTIEPGQVHHYRNTETTDCVFRCEVWPAARFEAMILTLFCLAGEGRTNADGVPSPLQMAVILDEFDDTMRIAGPPRWLQRLLLPPLARIGRARGLRPTYERHAELWARWQDEARTKAAA
jgi:mannose-6-phosphate isomerase-like protein (cupin superfamily)